MSIANLPNEILCIVFQISSKDYITYSNRDRKKALLTLLSICRHWRFVAEATPQLWSLIYSKDKELVWLSIQRSSDIPISVHYRQRDAWDLKGWALASPRMKELNFEEGFMHDSACVDSFFAPALERLTLRECRVANLFITPKKMPRLRSLILHNTPMNPLPSGIAELELIWRNELPSYTGDFFALVKPLLRSLDKLRIQNALRPGGVGLHAAAERVVFAQLTSFHWEAAGYLSEEIVPQFFNHVVFRDDVFMNIFLEQPPRMSWAIISAIASPHPKPRQVRLMSLQFDRTLKCALHLGTAEASAKRGGRIATVSATRSDSTPLIRNWTILRFEDYSRQFLGSVMAQWPEDHLEELAFSFTRAQCCTTTPALKRWVASCGFFPQVGCIWVAFNGPASSVLPFFHGPSPASPEPSEVRGTNEDEDGTSTTVPIPFPNLQNVVISGVYGDTEESSDLLAGNAPRETMPFTRWLEERKKMGHPVQKLVVESSVLSRGVLVQLESVVKSVTIGKNVVFLDQDAS